MYKFIIGDLPQSLDIIPMNDFTMGGRVVSLGENSIISNVELNIFTVDPNTGFRQNATPDTVLIPDVVI